MLPIDQFSYICVDQLVQLLYVWLISDLADICAYEQLPILICMCVCLYSPVIPRPLLISDSVTYALISKFTLVLYVYEQVHVLFYIDKCSYWYYVCCWLVILLYMRWLASLLRFYVIFSYICYWLAIFLLYMLLISKFTTFYLRTSRRIYSFLCEPARTLITYARAFRLALYCCTD